MTTLNLTQTEWAHQQSGGTVTLNPSSLFNVDSTSEYYGIRYTSLTIPAGATIDSAVMTITPADANNDEPDHPFVHQESAAPAAITSGSGADLTTNRPVTTASVTWSSANLGADGSNSFSPPDLSAVLQEVVDSQGELTGLFVRIQGSSSGTRDLIIKQSSTIYYDITYTATSSFVPRLSLLGVG